MIEIAIKIAQKPNGEGVAIGFIPRMDSPTDKEHIYASVVYRLLIDVVSPAIDEFTTKAGGESASLKGDKAIFFADQMGWLPDTPQEPEKN